MSILRLEHDICRTVTGTSPNDVLWGVAVVDNMGSLIAGYNHEWPGDALSISKLLVAAALRSANDRTPGIFDEDLAIQPSDVREGQGGFTQYLAGQSLDAGQLTVQKAAEAMLRASDTTAQVALVRRLGGPEAVNGLARPVLQPNALSGLIAKEGQSGPEARFFTGRATPLEAARLLLAALKLPLAQNALSQGIYADGLRRNLPNDQKPDPAYLELLGAVETRGAVAEGELDGLLGPTYPGSRYPNIVGIDEEDGSYHDVALVAPGEFPWVMAAFATGYDPARDHHWHPNDTHARLGELVNDFFQNHLFPHEQRTR